MGIQRWELYARDTTDILVTKDDQGDYVSFTDHEQVVADLRAELAAKSKDAAAVVKHASEVVAWFSSGNSIPIDGVHTMKVSNHSITTDIWQLRQALKAMGEGNGR